MKRSVANSGFIGMPSGWCCSPCWLVPPAVSARTSKSPMQPAPDYADLVLINGGIYTVDAERSWAEAAAVRDGVFVSVGSNADIEPLIGPANTRDRPRRPHGSAGLP